MDTKYRVKNCLDSEKKFFKKKKKKKKKKLIGKKI